MVDFSNLSKLDISDQTVDFTIHALEGAPRLTVRSALNDNAGYTNAVLKTSSAQLTRGNRRKANKETLDSTRDQDRELYAHHVVVDWSGITDNSGKAVPFNTANCLQFLKKLPDWLVDDLRTFCNNPVNFLTDDDINEEETAKN